MKDVNSPVNSTNTTSKLRGNLRGWSPGAKSDPGRATSDSVPSQSIGGTAARISRGSDEPAEIRVTRPEE